MELEYKFYIMEYTPISQTRGRVRLATNVNMGLAFLPLFVVNKSCRVFAFDYFKNVMRVSKEFKGSKWEQKMRENQEVYGFFRRRVRQHIEETQGI